MKLFSDCRGECCDCLIDYIGGCLAGHGDDMFIPLKPGDKERLRQSREQHEKNKKILDGVAPPDYGKQIGEALARHQDEQILEILEGSNDAICEPS